MLALLLVFFCHHHMLSITIIVLVHFISKCRSFKKSWEPKYCPWRPTGHIKAFLFQIKLRTFKLLRMWLVDFYPQNSPVGVRTWWNCLLCCVTIWDVRAHYSSQNSLVSRLMVEKLLCLLFVVVHLSRVLLQIAPVLWHSLINVSCAYISHFIDEFHKVTQWRFHKLKSTT